jgi:hypothetical protein
MAGAADQNPSSEFSNGACMTQYLGVDWLAMCLTFAAIFMLGNKSRKGFVVMMLGNLCWTAIGAWAHSYAMIIANIGFFSMNVRGFVRWASPETSGT